MLIDVRRGSGVASAAAEEDDLPVYSEKTLPERPRTPSGPSWTSRAGLGISSFTSKLSGIAARRHRLTPSPPVTAAPAPSTTSSFSRPPLRPLALPTMAQARLVPLRRRPESQMALIGAHRHSDLMAFDPLPTHFPVRPPTTNPFSTPFDDPHER